MGSGLYALLAFIVAIGILVTVHEFGHFWVARRVGVKVLRFSVGFGRPLWKRTGQRDGTEYVIAALPLGGYVKMLGEGGDEEVTESEKERSFDNQSLGARAAIVVAGPLFNFVFAVIAFAAVQMIGVSGMKPIIGEVAESSISSSAGLEQGDEIVSVNGNPVRIWQEALEGVLGSAVLGTPIALEVVSSSGLHQQMVLENPFGENIPEGPEMLEQLGFSINRPHVPPRIGELVSGGAAELAGFESGDLVLTVDGEDVLSWQDWVKWIQDSPGRPLTLTIERDEVVFPLELVPAAVELEQKIIGRIGA
ncbi:MAG: RIP metalloprotease RseP, partial [Gammaproteobacteria bacterium]|nr:RIP metalloprotease RseP [Gammaproteobacteria bacterium]